MTIKTLEGYRVLVVEDDYLIADDFRQRLTSVGAQILGPAATLNAGFSLYQRCDRLDFVLLDINLRGTAVYPLASRLLEDGVPFAFCSGYGDELIAEGFGECRRFEKPLSSLAFAELIDVIADARAPNGLQRQHLPM